MEKSKNIKEQLALSAILLLSFMLNFTNLKIEEYANEYYAAGVKSMMKNITNFFFVSFDPAGFVTIDKPPVGFWLQAISAKIFGYNSFGILFPQALAGVISVWVLYHLIKKYFGIISGLISALCLSITPIFVAASRNNTIDNILVMFLLLATIFFFQAIENGRKMPLFICLIFVGIGFNVKMLQAYFILPAIYLTYFLCSHIKLKERIANLTVGFILLLAVSFSWAAIVDLIPADSRPFVGSSSNNSELELIIGHNGIERFTHSGLHSGSAPTNYSTGLSPEASQGTNLQPPDTSETNIQGNPPNNRALNPSSYSNQSSSKQRSRSGFGQNTPAGLTRLFVNGELSDQISWLFPFAILGFIASIIKFKRRLFVPDNGGSSVLFWFLFLIPSFFYFSFTQGIFHPYYLTMLSAPISALVGIGAKVMWGYFHEKSWKSLFLPISFLLTGLVQIRILSYFMDASNIPKLLISAIVIFCFLSTLALLHSKARYMNPAISNSVKQFRMMLTLLALLGLFITPAIWSGTTLFYKMSGSFPSAGLSLIPDSSSDNEDSPFDTENDEKLIAFLQQNKTNETYLLVTSSASGTASSIIIETNESVMALGGFSGSDQILTLNEFMNMVKNGEFRYVLTNGMRGEGTDDNENTQIFSWVKENGILIEENICGVSGLYDLQGSLAEEY